MKVDIDWSIFNNSDLKQIVHNITVRLGQDDVTVEQIVFCQVALADIQKVLSEQAEQERLLREWPTRREMLP
jgi:hypothetical protein